ncbi:hypothetical protein [Variovorax soli]|uniref:hypothetical protein n=1 Tax=Variovorax soli TaxID=376815 RepID=UPI0008380C8D|nr:hypothetical protein [Variovorax soli]
MSAATVLAPRANVVQARDVAREATRMAILRAMGVMGLAQAQGQSLEATLAASVSEAEMALTRAAIGSINRSPQGPAVTTDPEWAGLLAEPSVEAFVSLWADVGIVTARAPLRRFVFNGKALKLPMRTNMGPPNLAAHWRSEGKGIRVGAMRVGTQVLAGQSMGILSTTTLEMLNAAGPGVLDAVVRAAIVIDSATVLEATVWSTDPATGDVPAGLGNVLPANTAISSGATADAITADLLARLGALIAAGYGSPSTFLAMNRLNEAALYAKLPEMQARATVLGLPVYASAEMPMDTVFLVDGGAACFGADPVLIETSQSTLLHEEGDANAVAENLGAATAHPQRSVWQTNALSWRGTLSTGWWAPPGAVQVLTGVAWA